jgi:ABC-type Fe3+ transport system substrate-binding protein
MRCTPNPAFSAHEDDAQKFVAFLVSAQAQRILAASDHHEYPARPGIGANPRSHRCNSSSPGW